MDKQKFLNTYVLISEKDVKWTTLQKLKETDLFNWYIAHPEYLK